MKWPKCHFPGCTCRCRSANSLDSHRSLRIFELCEWVDALVHQRNLVGIADAYNLQIWWRERKGKARGSLARRLVGILISIGRPQLNPFEAYSRFPSVQTRLLFVLHYGVLNIRVAHMECEICKDFFAYNLAKASICICSKSCNLLRISLWCLLYDFLTLIWFFKAYNASESTKSTSLWQFIWNSFTVFLVKYESFWGSHILQPLQLIFDCQKICVLILFLFWQAKLVSAKTLMTISGSLVLIAPGTYIGEAVRIGEKFAISLQSNFNETV